MSERPSATAVRETYFNAVYPSTSNGGVLTAGLHAVEASGYERGCADERRQVLDELAEWTKVQSFSWYISEDNLLDKLDEMREELDRGDG